MVDPAFINRLSTAARRGQEADLRRAVLDVFREHGAMSADQVAERLGQTVLAIRPRVSELHTTGFLVDTGEMVRNDSGRPARVWDLTQRGRE